MDLITAAVLGIVEGVTEFLPISSTGHMILAGRLMGLEPTEFLKSFEIAIQLGAIGAVVSLYWRSLTLDLEAIKRIVVAFIPTAILGLLLYKIVKHVLLGSAVIVLWSLALGGAFLILFELFHKEREGPTDTVTGISYPQAFVIGVFQSIAIIPGVSRAAATIVGGLILGIRRKTIVEFSFLLAVPTMAAATALDLLKSGAAFTGDQVAALAVGFLTAFIVALGAIKFLLAFIKTHSFIPFGAYRIILALCLWRLIR